MSRTGRADGPDRSNRPDGADRPDRPPSDAGRPDRPSGGGGDGGRSAPPEIVDRHDGDALLTVSWWGTGLFTALAVAAVAAEALRPVFAAVSGLLFVAGVVAFVRAYLIAVQRSREVLIGMGGLVFLMGCAPARVRRGFLAAFAVQLVVAFTAAGIGLGGTSPDTTNALAFGMFAPMYGLGLSALWGAHHGTFPARPPARGRGPRTR